MNIAEDKLEIIEMISRYSYGTDSTQAEGNSGIFTEDGSLKGRVGQPDERVLRGRAQIKAFHNAAVARRGSERHRHHQSTTIFLEIGENMAVTRTYLMVTEVREGKPPSIGLTSIYEDEFVRTPEGWLIKSRQILPDVKGELSAIVSKEKGR
jgi:hypothetical protein